MVRFNAPNSQDCVRFDLGSAVGNTRTLAKGAAPGLGRAFRQEQANESSPPNLGWGAARDTLTGGESLRLRQLHAVQHVGVAGVGTHPVARPDLPWSVAQVPVSQVIGN